MANEIKRHFYNNKDYHLDKENNVVHLLPDFFAKLTNKKLFNRFGFKKIGGSSIGDVLEVDQFKSEFEAFCRMSWIGMPILDRKYVDAGIAIEPKVVEVIEKLSGKKVTTYDPFKYQFDFFKDKDDVVGGLPDGYIEEDNKIIEIKTTGEKNFEKWNKYGVPSAYLKQAQLYAFLIDSNKYSIVATFLKDEDYIHPKKYPINKRLLKNWNYEVNILEAQDDIKKVKSWYTKYTNSPISPKWDNKKNADLLEWLDISSPEEWEELKQKWIKNGKLVV